MSERWWEVLRSVPDTTASAVCYIGWHYPVVGASLSCRSRQVIQALCPSWRPRCCVAHRLLICPSPRAAEVRRAQAGRVGSCPLGGCTSAGRVLPFMSFWFSRCWWLSILLFCWWTPGPSHLATPQVLHIWWPRWERDICLPPPTSVPSDPSLLFLFFFVHFTVKQRFWLRIWPSDKKTHRYLTIFKARQS